MEGRAGEVADEKAEQRKWLQRKRMSGVQKFKGQNGVKLKYRDARLFSKTAVFVVKLRCEAPVSAVVW